MMMVCMFGGSFKAHNSLPFTFGSITFPLLTQNYLLRMFVL